MRPAFYKVPPEIWEDVVGRLGKRDLAAFALTSKETYPAANRLLYSTLELSFCRCSESYYESLARTLTDHPELAALVTHLFIDMKVPCRIKAATSFDDLHPSRIFRPVSLIIAMSDHGRYTPMGQVDWNKEALQSLSNPNASDILAQLYNVEKLTVILGLFQNSSDILTSLFNSLPEDVLPSLRFLKIYDTKLDSSALRSISSLRVLDLGYVHVNNGELCAIVGENADVLEEIRLCWIMEPTQRPLFADYSGSAVKNLKVFTSQGPYPHSVSGLQRLIGDAPVLEELRLESQSLQSAVVWTQLFSDLTSRDNWTARHLRVLNLGAPAGCTEFWAAAAKLLYHCGDKLTALYINGSSRIAVAPFPTDLLRYFSSHTQPNLTNLVLIWRDDIGLTTESASALESYAPALELFHICLALPSGFVGDLLGMIKPFPRLRRAHFAFLNVRRSVGNSQGSTALDETAENMNPSGPVFREFLRRAVTQHEMLDEVSWCVYYRRAYTSQGPKAYVRIKRTGASAPGQSGSIHAEGSDEAFAVVDLAEECRKYETTDLPRFRCTVGSKKVLLTQRPSWREEMGNPFLNSQRICPYAEFNIGTEVRPQRREL